MTAREPVHLLVVDDDQDIRESLIEALENAGFSVGGAENGVEALAYLNSAAARPRLILLDLMMPIMDGFQFREAQLQDPRHAEIPVIVFTAQERAIEKASHLQAAAWLTKPSKIQPMLDLVNRIVVERSP